MQHAPQPIRFLAKLLAVVAVAACSAAASAEDLCRTIDFPSGSCDSVISYSNASDLLNELGDEESLGFALAITLGVSPEEIPTFHGRLKRFEIVQKLLRRGVFGVRVRDDSPEQIEWVAWISAEPQESRQLIAALRPFLEVNRLLVSSGISIAECPGGGLLLASEPSGSLRTEALERITDPATDGTPSDPVGPTQQAPIVVSFRHAEGLGADGGSPGVSRVCVSQEQGGIAVDYEGWFEPGTFNPPCCDRRLDVEIMQRMPDETVAVVVEHADTRLLPGTELIGRLLPHLLESERSDERWRRRVVVLGPSGGDHGQGVPAIAVAIEMDGPGASMLRQDVSVLASLNSLRNRLGTKAGLQHLPRLSDLPEDGPRTVYARALLEPVLGGNSISREISINWCQARGETTWQLYATCPELSSTLHDVLAGPTRALQCVKAAHAGRLSGENAAGMIRSIIPLAHEFTGEDRLESFRVGLALLFNFLWESRQIDWTVDLPDSGTVRARVNIWPRRDATP